MTNNEQQEKEVKELAEEIAEATAKGAYTSKELAQHLISKGYRKAGELTVISDEKFKEITDNVARDMGTTWEDIFEGSLEGRELEKYVIKVINKSIQAQCDHDREG